MDDRYLMCLCPRCRQYFQDAGGYRLRRARFPQETKDVCTYCQVRYGYDYYMEPEELIDLAELPDEEEDFYGDCI